MSCTVPVCRNEQKIHMFFCRLALSLLYFPVCFVLTIDVHKKSVKYGQRTLRILNEEKHMNRIRFAGRGGLGGKTAADLMAMMYYGTEGEDGKFPYVSATTTYGPERRGAPVDSFVRLSTSEIRELGPFGNPDMVIVLDGTLADAAAGNVVKGLAHGGILLINSRRNPSAYTEFSRSFRVYTVDASGIAVANGLGSKATPIVNTALLGAFVRVSGFGSLDILLQFIETKMKKKIDENKRVAIAAHTTVRGIAKE